MLNILYTTSGEHNESNMLSEGFSEQSLSTICEKAVGVISQFLLSKEGSIRMYLESHLLVQILCCMIFFVHMNKNLLRPCYTK
jgi:hypothetical protein